MTATTRTTITIASDEVGTYSVMGTATITDEALLRWPILPLPPPPPQLMM